jgi:hypothetical protein
MTWAMGLYFFAIAFVLAQLEIQIEVPHGWAAQLPTWRWDGPRVIRWAGKPITGYHVFLMTFILLFVHLPMVYLGFSLEREAELLSLFFMLAVFWDFLWFVCKPFGLAHSARTRCGGSGRGAGASVLLFQRPDPVARDLQRDRAPARRSVGPTGWRGGARLGVFLAPTLLTVAAVSMRRAAKSCRRPRTTDEVFAPG